ncbi:Flp pilus assembly protein TadD [Marinimicrobium koreense]|uniref:Flp pilus assembly protein TadD n=1 Tax=Marinimicrobium koreense TaxID=306545 RepID=A0A3N1P013_9GAMM|nr:tetratricopeptide repeat protein [Marinimicrobium koreense]ROQ20938.1 Flp pilus assembly protein TadD [Marinimicrobium koreense]
MNASVPLVTALALSALLLGCAQQPTGPEREPASASEPAEPSSDRADAAQKPEPRAAQPAPTRPFTSDTLYALLAAEIAGSRQQFDIALSNYLQQAHQTRDPQVAARATHIARFLSANNALLDAALLWVEVAPDDTEAQLNAALALVQNGRLQEAFDLSRKLQAKGEHTLFQNIAASASEATDTQRERLIDGYLTLLEEYPEHQELLIGTGLLMQQQGDLEPALDYASRALKEAPDSVAATILKATLLNQLERSDEALQTVVGALEDNPESLRLRLQYARLLTQHDLAMAQEQFEVLVRQEPRDPDLRLSLGIVALERGDTETAQTSFESLLDSDEHASSANFYLGQLAERQGRNEEALLYYLQVEPGSDFLQATINIMELLIDSGQLEAANDHMNRMRNRFPDRAADLYLFQARVLLQKGHEESAEALLVNALEAHPTHSDLLYSRAMLYDQQGRLEAAERDLRNILTYDPHNATALNALGYILTDKTDRHEEAYELIRQALALNPEEPAILDSMGWVLYNLGRPEEALPYLQDAMSAYPDQEIAAHLGEVLWQLGRKEEARAVWQQGLETDPESELIPATRERLGVDAEGANQ